MWQCRIVKQITWTAGSYFCVERLWSRRLLTFRVLNKDGHIEVLYIVMARAKCGLHRSVLLPQNVTVQHQRLLLSTSCEKRNFCFQLSARWLHILSYRQHVSTGSWVWNDPHPATYEFIDQRDVPPNLA